MSKQNEKVLTTQDMDALVKTITSGKHETVDSLCEWVEEAEKITGGKYTVTQDLRQRIAQITEMQAKLAAITGGAE